MRKTIGILVAFFPIIAALAVAFYFDWRLMAMVVLYTALALDVIGWCIWFIALGAKIMDEE